MSPTPKEVGPSGLEPIRPFEKARWECAQFLQGAEEKAKLKTGASAVRVTGLILDRECVHPLVEVRSFDSLLGRENVGLWVIGGEDFWELYSVSGSAEKNKYVSVNWRRDNGRQEELLILEGLLSCYPSSKDCLVIKTDHYEYQRGIVLFPPETVEEGSSFDRIFNHLKEIANKDASFLPLLEGLRKAAGLK